MQNYIQPGNVLTLAAPYDRTSGQAAKIGSIIAIATQGVLSAAVTEWQTEGVFDVDKNSAEAWTVGLILYWDDSAKCFTLTSSANTKCAVAVKTAANPSATGRVRLNGSFI